MKVQTLLEGVTPAKQKLPKASDDEFDDVFAMSLFNHMLEDIGVKQTVLSPHKTRVGDVESYYVSVKDRALYAKLIEWIKKNSKVDRLFTNSFGRRSEVHRFPTFYMLFDLPHENAENPSTIYVTRKRPEMGRSGFRVRLEDDPESMMHVLLDRALKNGKTVDVLVTAADGFHKVGGTLVRAKKSPVKVKTHEFGVVEKGHRSIVEKFIIDRDADLRWELVPDPKGNFLLRDVRKPK